MVLQFNLRKMDKLKESVLKILRRSHNNQAGWWMGYSELSDQVLEDIGERHEKPKLKQACQQLRKDGKLIVLPIFREEDMMANGSGYFASNTFGEKFKVD